MIKNCLVKINNESIDFDLFIKKLLVINLHKSNMYFNLDNLVTTNKTISNKNIYLKFNNISKITKININNDELFTNTSIDSIDFNDESNEIYLYNDINYSFDYNDIYLNMSEFDDNRKKYIDDIDIHLQVQYSSLFLYNLSVLDKNIEKHYKKYNNKNILYLIQEKNLWNILFLFLYNDFDVSKYLTIFSNFISKNNLFKINNTVYNCRNFILKLGRFNRSISNLNYSFDSIKVIDNNNFEIQFHLTANYVEKYFYNDILLNKADNQKFKSKTIKLYIELNNNKLIKYILTSDNINDTFEDIMFNNETILNINDESKTNNDISKTNNDISKTNNDITKINNDV